MCLALPFDYLKILATTACYRVVLPTHFVLTVSSTYFTLTYFIFLTSDLAPEQLVNEKTSVLFNTSANRVCWMMCFTCRWFSSSFSGVLQENPDSPSSHVCLHSREILQAGADYLFNSLIGLDG